MMEWRRHVVSAAVVGVFTALAAGSGQKTSGGGTGTTGNTEDPKPARAEEKPAAPAPAIAVSAGKLFSDYQANEVSADEKYKGKRLRVTGAISSITKDFMGNVVLNLRTPNQFMSVMATLEDSEKNKAGQLSKGENVTVTCEGGGMVVGSPMLADCTID